MQLGLFKKLFHENNERNLALIVFIFASLISLTWFRGDNLIGQGDNSKAINFLGHLSSLDSSWRYEEGTGSREYSLQHHFPLSLVYFPLDYAGLDSVSLEKIWLLLTLLIPSYLMYVFITKFLGREVPFVFRVSASLYYIINPLLILHPLGISPPRFPVYAFLPLYAYFLVSIFTAASWRIKYRFALLFALSSVLISASFRNVAGLAPLFIVLFVLTTYYLFKSTERLKYIFLLGSTAVLSFLLNFWWIVSSFYNQFAAVSEFVQRLGDFSPTTSLFDSLRLMGSWAILGGHRGFSYFPFWEFYYERDLGVILSFAIPILVFSGVLLLILTKKSVSDEMISKIKLMLFLSFFGPFLVKGSTPPLGGWYAFLYSNFPLFKVFREPYTKFSLVTLFAFSVMSAASLYLLITYFSSRFKKINRRLLLGIMSVAYVTTILLVSYPIVNSEVVPDFTNGVVKQAIVVVPQHWKDIQEYSKNVDSNQRVLTLPRNGYYGTSYLWPKGFSGNAHKLLYKGNSINYRHKASQPGQVLINELYDEIYSHSGGVAKNTIKIKNLMRILHVGFVLQQNDFDWRNINSEDPTRWSPESMRSFLADFSDDLTLKQEFGILSKDYLKSVDYIVGGANIYRVRANEEAGIPADPTEEVYVKELLGLPALQLYSVAENARLPKIYFADYYRSVSSADEFDSLLGDSLIEVKPFIETTDLSNERQLSVSPPLNIKKVNDAKYEVRLSGSPIGTGVLHLVFGESFDADWVLVKECNLAGCRGQVDATHVQVNGYANGWKIKKSEVPTTFYIYHLSDGRLRVGVGISLLAMLFSVVGYIRLRKDEKIPN